jgi:hypothetical protein
MDAFRKQVTNRILEAYVENQPKTLIHAERRTGLSTSILFAICELTNSQPASVLLVCSDQRQVEESSRIIAGISHKATSQTEIYSFHTIRRKLQQRGGWSREYDLIIIDDHEFFDLRKELRKNTKKMILCQTSPRKIICNKNKLR